MKQGDEKSDVAEEFVHRKKDEVRDDDHVLQM